MRSASSRTLWLSVVLGTGALMGCANPADWGGATLTEEAVSSPNGLRMINGLSMTNGLSSANGLSMTNGLSSVNGLSMTNGLLTSDTGRTTLGYLVRCALPAGHSIRKAYNGTTYTFAGQLGLGAGWETGACDTNCQQLVSACMMAHVNTSGKHINLWIDSPTIIGLGRNSAYPMQESAFFGNIFVNPPKAYYCNGFDWDRGPAAGRIGATQSGSPYSNPFGTNALCKNSCSTVGRVGEAYGSCDGYNNVITVYRDFRPDAEVQHRQRMDRADHGHLARVERPGSDRQHLGQEPQQQPGLLSRARERG